MVAVIALLLLLLVVALVIVLIRRMVTTKRVNVAEDIMIGGDARAIEPALVASLGSVEGANHGFVAPGLHAVEIRRIPVWAVIPVCLLFPVGLVFLFVRESIRLDVAVFDGQHGAVVRLSGRTESFILDRVRAALSQVPVG